MDKGQNYRGLYQIRKRKCGYVIYKHWFWVFWRSYSVKPRLWEAEMVVEWLEKQAVMLA